ncbi:MAG: hypothetical protein IPJ17_08535 [Holophagales bacterium]|nr:MAG: hypothetical protein IPJ17_08535 [Holophagales bacterium]
MKNWLLLLVILGLLVAGELSYSRYQVATGSNGEELLDAWLLPLGTILVLAGCFALAKGRGAVAKLVAGFAVVLGAIAGALGYVLVTRW